jgi:hypothetical protein
LKGLKMMRLQLTVAALAIAMCCATAEARGRRGGYSPYYYNNYNYNNGYTVVPATNATPAQTVVSTTPATTTTAQPAATTGGDIVQVTANKPETGVVQASATTPAADPNAAAAPKPVVAGSAQWKAEQCARMGAVAHLGGSFGGGSHEGCGFGATADQAIRNSCFWGQLTPIEIGVAAGANGYYAVIFYR